MIVYAYEARHGVVFRLLVANEHDRVQVEVTAYRQGWSLIHTYPIEEAYRYG